MSVKYIYEAEIVFIERSSGVYNVGKSKVHNYSPGEFVTNIQVANELSKRKKVAVCKNNLENYKYANFEIEEEDDGNA